MKTHNLKLFNTGQITLPKSRREQHKTNLFIAEETTQGLLIKPILSQNENETKSVENFISAFKKQAVKQGFNENEIEQMVENAKMS